MMAGWEDLDHELDAWWTDGRDATFWRRDDDAGAATPALERPIGIAGDAGGPWPWSPRPPALAWPRRRPVPAPPCRNTASRTAASRPAACWLGARGLFEAAWHPVACP